MVKFTAVMVGVFLALATGVSFAANPAPVVVTNAPSAPVPVSGTVGVTGTVSVGNSRASRLFVAPTAGVSTSLAASNSFTFAQVGTVQTQTVSVGQCSQIRIGVSTANNGDTVVVTVFNDLGMQLDEFIVGTALGGNTINTTRVYDTPGVSVYMWLTPQNLPTGVPINWGLWCR